MPIETELKLRLSPDDVARLQSRQEGIRVLVDGSREVDSHLEDGSRPEVHHAARGEREVERCLRQGHGARADLQPTRVDEEGHRAVVGDLLRAVRRDEAQEVEQPRGANVHRGVEVVGQRDLLEVVVGGVRDLRPDGPGRGRRVQVEGDVAYVRAKSDRAARRTDDSVGVRVGRVEGLSRRDGGDEVRGHVGLLERGCERVFDR